MIEPNSGTSVNLVVNLQGAFYLQPDGVLITEKAQNVFVPMFALNRTVFYTEDQMDDNFGPLKIANIVEIVIICLGCVVGVILGILFFKCSSNLKKIR